LGVRAATPFNARKDSHSAAAAVAAREEAAENPLFTGRGTDNTTGQPGVLVQPLESGAAFHGHTSVGQHF
jgi:hypothetical protein